MYYKDIFNFGALGTLLGVIFWFGKFLDFWFWGQKWGCCISGPSGPISMKFGVKNLQNLPSHHFKAQIILAGLFDAKICISKWPKMTKSWFFTVFGYFEMQILASKSPARINCALIWWLGRFCRLFTPNFIKIGPLGPEI